MEPGMDNSDTLDSSRMEGFGSETLTTPFHYGSVSDGMSHGSSLEQKLKKKYWKTKQSVIQKLGKSQDEFVIAGDADIDTKLEKAYHLRSSCQDLLLALERYAFRTRVLSSQELIMGEYLTCVSETEFTNAGEVMHKVGKVQEKDSLTRMDVLPPLVRMQQEFATFKGSAITDLDYSIHTLEKARTEYRAALLWMKNVSEKLKNPDYRDQLSKFREAQAAVKDTKHRFEKLKGDLSEKIDMVSASRCNLLSRSLPAYQKQILAYMNKSASEFHQVLADLRANHHHQYRVTKVMQEIRDLELEEGQGSETPEAFPTEGEGEGEGVKREEDDDDPLIDVGEATISVGGKGEEENSEKEAVDIDDLELTGLGADLEELLEQPPSARDELNDLLGLGQQSKGGNQQSTAGDSESAGKTDQLFDAWSDFSAFMSGERTDASVQSSDWQKELMKESLLELEGNDGGAPPLSSQPQAKEVKQWPAVDEDSLLKPVVTPGGGGERNGLTAPPQPSEPLGHEIDSLLGLDSEPPLQPPCTTGTSLADDILALTLGESLPSSRQEGASGVGLESGKTEDTGAGLEALNPTLFQQQSTLPPSLTSLYTTPALPSQTTAPTYPPSFPSAHGTNPYTPFRSPMNISHGPIVSPKAIFGPGAGVAGGSQLTKPGAFTRGGGKESTRNEKEGGKGNSWMNVFAHLDPLASEKA